MTEDVVSFRPASEDDTAAMARLHCDAISDGFLPRLGHHFMRRLYRRIVRWPGAFAIVADSSGEVVGFIAGTGSVSGLYRQFLLRDGPAAVARAGPRMVRALPRVVETLAYGRTSSDAREEPLPDPELLAVAVAASARGRGVGRALVVAFQDELLRRGSNAARVVVGSHNAEAIALYQRCGFRPVLRREVHRGITSEVLVWP